MMHLICFNSCACSSKYQLQDVRSILYLLLSRRKVDRTPAANIDLSNILEKEIKDLWLRIFVRLERTAQVKTNPIPSQHCFKN